MHVLLFLGYIGLCLLVAVLGRNTRIGYWGTAIVSVLITPFVMFLLLFFLMPRIPAKQS